MSESDHTFPVARETSLTHPVTDRTTTSRFTRRTWLALNSASVWAVASPFKTPQLDKSYLACAKRKPPMPVDERAEASRDTMRQMAQRAVEAARAAGAQYADAHLTRSIRHSYSFGAEGYFGTDIDWQGIGVRALVNGYWGFAACPTWEPDDVTQIARDAVAQARTNAKGPSRTVELGTYPTARGEWATSVAIDPFSISIEEKADYMDYWRALVDRYIPKAALNTLTSYLLFVRQERITANTEGSLVAQTLYESGGSIEITDFQQGVSVFVENVDMRGQGWERLLNAKIPEQLPAMRDELQAKIARKRAAKPNTIGQYTVVCDGRTMATVLDKTLGLATQLDRALGYEANSTGTSFLSDPLTMAGQYQVASPVVTITANRSEAGQLATVKWDEEGVEPAPFTLVKDGTLVDYQTTREQAAWLAPYYQTHGKPVRSNGCAASQDALTIPMQHMPNLVLEPGTADHSTDELIANVPKGLYLENGVVQTDFQVRGGVIKGDIREIQDGRLGRQLDGGAILFNTEQLWKAITAVGGAKSAGIVPVSQYEIYKNSTYQTKGQPGQANSHSIRAVAATLEKQKLVILGMRA